MQNKTARRGFTVLELITAVVGLLIMAAVFFPVFEHRREKARKTICQNNLKKIAIGVKQYMNDYDEYYPLVFVTDAPGPNPPRGWADALQPYVRNPAIYQCPSDTNPASESPSQSGYTDYWYNANIMWRLNRNGTIIFKSCEQHGTPYSSRTILIGDGGNADNSGGHNATYNQCGDGKSLSGRSQICAPSKSLTATYPAAQIHLGGANFAFADGHVKWVKGDSASMSAQIMDNRATLSNIGHNYTFSLLNRQ